MWPLERVKPYDRNPRQNDSAVAGVAKSIERFGFRQPIVVSTDEVIIVGHTRWKAAKKLGLKEVPVHVAQGLTDDEIRAYRIADNKTNEAASWDLELLPLEIGELQAADFELELLGFDQESLAKLLDAGVAEGECDPDECPLPPEEPTTRRGDLWVLGEHRLLCGDSSHGDGLARLLEGETVQLLNTDPPYNVAVSPRSKNAIAAGTSTFDKRTDSQTNPGADPSTKESARLRAKDRPIENDCMSEEEYVRMLEAWFGAAAQRLEPGRAFYVWGGYANCANYPPVLKAHGLYFSQAIIWHKMHPVIGRKDFMGDHEWCFYGWREGAAHKFFGPKNIADVWPVKKVNPQSMVHLTEKPVELARRAIQYSTLTGEVVLDLFGGSGSTLIAAEQMRRRARLMEIDPQYCDVIVSRWEQFTGRQAECVADVANSPA